MASPSFIDRQSKTLLAISARKTYSWRTTSDDITTSGQETSDSGQSVGELTSSGLQQLLGLQLRLNISQKLMELLAKTMSNNPEARHELTKLLKEDKMSSAMHSVLCRLTSFAERNSSVALEILQEVRDSSQGVKRDLLSRLTKNISYKEQPKQNPSVTNEKEARTAPQLRLLK